MLLTKQMTALCSGLLCAGDCSVMGTALCWGPLCAGDRSVLGTALCWGPLCAGDRSVLGAALCWGLLCAGDCSGLGTALCWGCSVLGMLCAGDALCWGCSVLGTALGWVIGENSPSSYFRTPELSISIFIRQTTIAIGLTPSTRLKVKQ